jgi:hypothetical protein
MMDAQTGFVAANRHRMEALDDWSLPFVKKYGDGPLIELIRLHQAESGETAATGG